MVNWYIMQYYLLFDIAEQIQGVGTRDLCVCKIDMELWELEVVCKITGFQNRRIIEKEMKKMPLCS